MKRLKAFAAASVVALGVVPFLASAAHAEVESEARIFQLVELDRIDQDADARSGQNDAWNDINQSGNSAGNTANNNEADITNGDSTAQNSITEIDIFQWAQQWATQNTTGCCDVESEARITQRVEVDIDQDADARSGQNDAWNNINQPGNTAQNNANGNTATIDAGDSTAGNSLDHLHINQHAENTADQTTTEEDTPV